MAKAQLDFLLKIFGTAQRLPRAGTGTHKPAFGRDDETFGIGMERFRDDFLANEGPVSVGGIDEVDAEFDRALEDTLRFRAVFGFAPDAFPGEAHGAKSEAVDRSLAAEGEGAAGLCRDTGYGAHTAFDAARKQKVQREFAVTEP
jgi:hypothetical protein